ncbi:MAG: STAS/SEC14 domain-containing protein [Nanoarchaeota archaeon]|nr:STAS/SEC14 domain-containing protein [Nanoarchaeota archaeon]
MTIKAYMGEDGIVRNINAGDITDEDVGNVDREIRELVKEIPLEKRRILVDLRKIGKATSGARKAYSESAKSGVVPKFAVLVATTYHKVLASFILTASGMSKSAKVFINEEEALKWLKE